MTKSGYLLTGRTASTSLVIPSAPPTQKTSATTSTTSVSALVTRATTQEIQGLSRDSI